MRYSHQSTISASPERVWDALIDIERWPDHIGSYESVERVDDGPLREGSTARVRQPGLRPTVFRVTDLQPGREFTWASDTAGVRTVARHVLEPDGAGGTRLLLTLEQTGVLAPVAKLLLGRKIRRYLGIESAGLRQISEKPGAAGEST